MEFPPSLVAPIDGLLEFIYSFGPLVEPSVVLGKFVDACWKTHPFDGIG